MNKKPTFLEYLFFILGIILLLSSSCATDIQTAITTLILCLLFLFFGKKVIIYLIKKDKVKKYISNKIYFSKYTNLINTRVNLVKKIHDLNQEIDKANQQILIANNHQKEIQQITEQAKLHKKLKISLDSEISELNNIKINLTNEINDLKHQKALLIDEIEQINSNKPTYSVDNDIYFSIEYVDKIKDGIKFEKYFSELLEKLGYYNISITSATGDFGIDVIAYNDDICYGFQCKLYSNNVSNSAVQEAYSGMKHYNCNIAIVVTNNFFTEQAKKQAKETNIILWDRNVLTTKLQEANKIDFTINKH